MKKSLLLIFIFISFFAKAQNIKALDELNGFQDIHFGDSISKHPGVKVFEMSKDSLFSYAKRAEDSRIYPNANVEIVYTYYKGQLANVFIGTNDSASSRLVLKDLKTKFGTGKKPDPYVEKYMWYGTKVILSYAEHINRFTAKVFFNSIPMQLKIEGRN